MDADEAIVVVCGGGESFFIEPTQAMQHPQAVRFLGRGGFFVMHHFCDGFDGGLADAVNEFVGGEHAAADVGAGQFGDEF